MNNKFLDESIRTIGIDCWFKKIYVNFKPIKLELVIYTQWDSAWGERGDISSLYLRDSSAIIVVLDKSSQTSLDYCESYIKRAKDCADKKTVLMVMANKSDLEPVVISEQGQELAFRFGAIYSEVSAKKNENIKNSFRVLATEALRFCGM